ncbi:MAG: helix-turn-helix domain-containing protein [Egibacteraceae bacterium]
MSSSPEIPIGERIRFYRDAKHKTQVVVAGLAGISADYLSQIERGLKTPTINLLHRIAKILGVPTSTLLGEPVCDDTSRGHPSSAAMHAALLGYRSPEEHEAPPDPGDLRRRVEDAWTTWQSSPSRYTELGRVLPDLVQDVQLPLRALRGQDQAAHRREAFRTAAHLYFLVRSFCKRIGRMDLCLLAADRGTTAAEEADDPLLITAARWNLGHALIADNEPEGAEEVATRAVEELEPHLSDSSTVSLAMFGALHLVAAIAAVRRGDAWTARERLRDKALPAARVTGEGNVCWTVFGPTNVGMHSISVEMEAGEASEALRLADDVDVSRLPSIERQMTFYLELARCYDQRREDPAVLLHLFSAERLSPEDIRYNALARDLVRGLVKRARPSYLPDVRKLAARIGLL